jgi:hypothetical protein
VTGAGGDRRATLALETRDRLGGNRHAHVLPQFEHAAGNPEQPPTAVEQPPPLDPGETAALVMILGSLPRRSMADTRPALTATPRPSGLPTA